MLVSEVYKHYLKELKSKGRSESTIANYRNALNQFINRCGDMPIAQINRDCLKEWQYTLDEEVSVNSVNTYIVAIRAFLRFLADEYGLMVDPNWVKPPKRTHTKVDYVELEEVQWMIDYVERRRDKAIIAVLYSTGLRNFELCKLNRSDYKEDRLHVVGKGGKYRTVFLNPAAKHLLDTYLYYREDDNEAMFIGTKNPVRLTEASLRSMFRTVSEKTGVEASPHMLRHGFATRMVKLGMPGAHIQYLLGHSKIETTQRYTHVMPVDVKASFDKTPLFD